MSFDPRRDPFENLEILVKEATAAGLRDPNAMTLATAVSGQPSARVVFYKGLVRGGLSFYTNYEGRKGHELTANPKAGVNFFWPELETQARIEGVTEKLTRAESEAYFRTRARLSQVGAWASHQSEEISGLEELQRRVDDVERRFAGVEVPCPPHWGGFRLVPHEFEFWFGRGGRLHERYVYERRGDGWRTFMRSP